MSSPRKAADSIFHMHDVTKVYHVGDVEVQALRGITLDLLPGEFVVMLGPSGSGKSTLLNILGGLDVPTNGEVFYRDHNLSAATREELTRFRREHVGFVFQFYNLIPSLTALENTSLVTEIAAQPLDAEECLRLVGLGERLHHFPAQMSGGEQQRVAIARAVVKKPEILLCDEPTGALDYATGKLVLEMVIPAGAPLVVLGDSKKIEIVTDVLTTDGVNIHAGAPVVVEGWGGDHPLRAKVRLVEPSGFTKVSALGVEEKRVNVISDFVDAPDGLGDGFRVETRIVTWQGGNVLKIPGSAVFRSGDAWSVFVIENGRAVQKTAEIGHRNQMDVEIRSGLTPGQEVVLHPPNQLKNGARIKAS